MECGICEREGCQIGWHLEATSKAKVKADGKTEQSQGQEQTEMVGKVEVGAAVRKDAGVLPQVGAGHFGDKKYGFDKRSYQREYMRRRRAAKAKVQGG